MSVLAGGSTSSSMDDVENIGKFSTLKSSPRNDRRVSAFKVKNGRKELKGTHNRAQTHKQHVSTIHTL